MNEIIFLAVGLVILLALLAVVKAKFGEVSERKDVYYARKALFTPAERSFLGVLEAQLPPGVRVFGKVRLEDILGVKSGLTRPARTAARNRINRKHVDFLLVRTSDLAPLAGIELDDSSHEEDDRRDRDALVDAAFASAAVPLLHFPAQKAYSAVEVKERLAGVLKEVV